MMAAVHWDGRPIETAVLAAANACVQYRCPDGAWLWADGAVGLAQADHATLPDDQPGVPVALGRLRIVASCRIDNRDELRRALPDALLPPNACDAAYVLAAYRAWGESCPARLYGDFAFVIWDGERQCLFAARDLSGARTLFYYHDQARLLLASERTQLMQDPTIPFDDDEEQLVAHLTPAYQWSSGWDEGLLRGVRMLEAGHTLRAERGRLVTQPYWHWHEHAFAERPAHQLIDEYRHALSEAIRCRMRSRNGRVAIELSGGLDSAAIACLAAQSAGHGGTALHTLSQIFTVLPQAGERERIQAVLDRYPALQPHFVAVDDLYGPQFLAPGWAPRAIIGPQHLSAAQAATPFYGAALEHGCQIVLSGDMGNSLNDGYAQVYYDMMHSGRPIAALRRLCDEWRSYGRHALREFALYGLAPLLMPMPLLRAGLALAQWRGGPGAELPAYIAAPLRQRIMQADTAIRWARAQSVSMRSPTVRWSLAELFPPMPGCTEPMPFQLEARYPYSDRRLIELVLAMPPEQKWQHDAPDGEQLSRWHHRRALKGILPNRVLCGNPGFDFSPAIKRSLQPAHLRRWLLDAPTVHLFARGYVDREAFLAALAQPEAEHNYLATMLCIEAWLRALSPGGAMRMLAPARRPAHTCQLRAGHLCDVVSTQHTIA